MSDLKRVGAIEVEQDLKFQRGEWRFQRIGRIVLAAIILLGLLGALGKGPLAHATRKSTAGDISVRYERIVRHHSETGIAVSLPGHTGTATIWIGQEYLEGVQLREVVPAPISTRATNDRVEFVFDVLPAARINFTIEPERVLMRPLDLGVLGGSSLRIRQFVLP